MTGAAERGPEKPGSSGQMRYRPEVDGLRTIAIVPVVLYHLGLISGGFVGVDVFFVISGYLITTQLLKAEPFNLAALAEFYSRRIKRLMPALSVVCVFVLIVAWAIYLPTDLRDVGRSVVAATLFSSNVLFWLRTGYFEPSALTKPMLHTWSLAVEEQFYIVFPLAILLIRRMSLSGRVWFLGLLALLSLAFSVWATTRYPAFAFYMLPARAWELLTGSLLAVTGQTLRGRWGSGLALAGVVGLLAVSLLYNDDLAFPGFWALPVVVFTALAIAGSNQGLVHNFLASSPMVLIGKLSYSWYLWHWPMIVFVQYYVMRDLTGIEQCALFFGSLLAAYLSWRFVEMPVRHMNWPRWRVFAAAVVVSAVFIGAGAALHFRDGVPDRFPTTTETPLGAEAYNGGTCFINIAQPFSEWSPEACRFLGAGEDKPLVVLWGDSYAAHYFPGLQNLQSSVPFDLVQINASGCPPFVDYTEVNRPNCLGFNQGSLAWILAEKPAVVVYSLRWNRYRDLRMIRREADRAVGALRDAGIEVVVVGESPVYTAPVPQIRQVLALRGQDGSRLKPMNDFAANSVLAEVARENQAVFFSPQAALCTDGRCRLAVDGVPVHWDQGHLSVVGSEYLVTLMRPQLELAIARSTARRP